MSVSAINGINSDSAATPGDLPSKVLSQNDFLKLLIAQMTSQDPINPMDNQDMLTQMVQFSTLQGNNSMQGALTQMQSGQSLLQANALLGRQVTLQVDTGVVT